METQAQSPPTRPSTPGRGRRGGGDKERGGGTVGRKNGEPGCVPRGRPLESRQAEVVGTQAQCQRHKGRGGLSPHTRQQAGLSHVHSPRPEARAHPRAHTAFGTGTPHPPPTPPTHTLMLQQRPRGFVAQDICAHTHTQSSCLHVSTHTHTQACTWRTCSPSYHQKLESNFLSGSQSQECPLFCRPTPQGTRHF